MFNLSFLGKWLQVFILGWITSFYLFPVGFAFAPAVNSKMILAVAGLALLGLQVVRNKSHSIGRPILIAIGISIMYSIVNLIATDYNGLSDYSYANYITTALVWLSGAYMVSQGIIFVHGKVNFKLITFYCAAVCALQCVVALIFDYVPGVEALFSKIFYLNPSYFIDVGRLFGIGAALDPAGTRFAIVLIMIAVVLTLEKSVQQSLRQITFLFLAFAIIISIGNIMSRTTTTGAIWALLLLFVGGREGKWFAIKKEYFKIYGIFSLILLLLVPTIVYFYNTDDYFYEQIRYGFEGFFSLVEKGYWQTSSNDILAEMWKWPTTDAGWIIGYGEFGTFRYGTDIGYCRFILYSGVIGISVFSLLFIHSAISFYRRYPKYRIFWFLLLCMTFIIWIKVSTDLFQFWALFYAFVDYDELAPQYKAKQEGTPDTATTPALTP